MNNNRTPLRAPSSYIYIYDGRVLAFFFSVFFLACQGPNNSKIPLSVSASNTFITANQALINLSPNTSASAGFLAVPASQANPSATAAAQLLAYRTVSFTGTSPELIQFALSHTATLDSSGEVDKGTDWKAALLSPSTEYKLIMYSNGSSSNIHSFSTEALFPLKDFNQRLSPQNFTTNSAGKFQVPFVFSWKFDRASDTISITERNADLSRAGVISALTFGSFNAATPYTGLISQLGGDGTEGAALLYTPRSNSLMNYRFEVLFNDPSIAYILSY